MIAMLIVHTVMSKPTVTVVMASYGEAENLEALLPQLRVTMQECTSSFNVLVVNDVGEPDPELIAACAKHGATVVDTPYNMGSQGAVLYGLRRQVEAHRAEYVVTMDADGQDDVTVISRLLAAAKPRDVVVAQRCGSRPEGFLFGLGYCIYKRLFSFFVGFVPDFGNFAAFTQLTADHISRSPHFDTTFSMALPLVGTLIRVPATRLPRIKGASRIGSKGLLDHALRSMLPHLRYIAIRIALVALIPSLISITLMLTAISLRIFSPKYAFSNWATIITFGTVSVCLQLFTVCMILFLTASMARLVSSHNRDTGPVQSPKTP